MLRSLLLSQDDATVRIVARCFRDLEVELERCQETHVAIQKAAETRFDAIVIDDEIEDGRTLLERVLELPTCGKAVRIVLARQSVAMDSVFKTGTQVVLYKPLSTDRVRHGLRAVRNLMARERRRGANRVPIMISAKLIARQGRGAVKQVLISDLSESGAAINAEGELAASASFSLDFTLSGSSDRIQATAELVWRNHEGAAGLRFIDMSSPARKQLAEWLKQSLAKEKEKAQAALASRAGK